MSKRTALEAECADIRRQLDDLDARVRIDAVADEFLREVPEFRAGDLCVIDGFPTRIDSISSDGKWTYFNGQSSLESFRVPPSDDIQRLYRRLEVAAIVAKTGHVARPAAYPNVHAKLERLADLNTRELVGTLSGAERQEQDELRGVLPTEAKVSELIVRVGRLIFEPATPTTWEADHASIISDYSRPMMLEAIKRLVGDKPGRIALPTGRSTSFETSVLRPDRRYHHVATKETISLAVPDTVSEDMFELTQRIAAIGSHPDSVRVHPDRWLVDEPGRSIIEQAMTELNAHSLLDDGYNVTVPLDGLQPGGFVRPPVEKYVRTSVDFGGYTSEPAVEWRDGEDDWAVMIANLEDIAHRVFVGHHPPQHQMDAARQLGAGMAQRWPGRAYFVEVWQDGMPGFAQVFQPFGVPRNR